MWARSLRSLELSRWPVEFSSCCISTSGWPVRDDKQSNIFLLLSLSYPLLLPSFLRFCLPVSFICYAYHLPLLSFPPSRSNFLSPFSSVPLFISFLPFPSLLSYPCYLSCFVLTLSTFAIILQANTFPSPLFFRSLPPTSFSTFTWLPIWSTIIFTTSMHFQKNELYLLLL
jgi:hypothetical protein